MKDKPPKVKKPAKRGSIPYKQVKAAVKKVISQRRSSKKCQVAKFTRAKEIDFPQEEELYNRVIKLVHEYNGEIGMAAAIGVIRLVGKYLEDIDE